MYVIRRGTKGRFEYLSYDEVGRRRWSSNKLDAIRMTMDQARDGFRPYLKGAGKLRAVGMDGHYETYQGVNLQVFKKGRYWKVRTCVSETGDNPWTVARKGCKSAKSALRYVHSLIQATPTTV